MATDPCKIGEASSILVLSTMSRTLCYTISMTQLSEDILRLRSEGMTYDQIKAELNCSKSTISYYLGEGQKSKTQERTRKSRSEDSLTHRIYGFTKVKPVSEVSVVEPDPVSALRWKTHDFARETDRAPRAADQSEIKKIKEKVMSNPVCYLTGKPIDLTLPRTYELDHITPRALGGDNTVGNVGLASREANRAKHDLPLDEFLDLCYDVLKHHNRI